MTTENQTKVYKLKLIGAPFLIEAWLIQFADERMAKIQYLKDAKPMLILSLSSLDELAEIENTLHSMLIQIESISEGF